MEEDIKEYKIKPLPKENCMFQGVVNCCGRICCDSIGTDMSPEFCFYCRFHATILKMKPYKFASRFHDWLWKLDKENLSEKSKK